MYRRTPFPGACPLTGELRPCTGAPQGARNGATQGLMPEAANDIDAAAVALPAALQTLPWLDGRLLIRAFPNESCLAPLLATRLELGKAA